MKRCSDTASYNTQKLVWCDHRLEQKELNFKKLLKMWEYLHKIGVGINDLNRTERALIIKKKWKFGHQHRKLLNVRKHHLENAKAIHKLQKYTYIMYIQEYLNIKNSYESITKGQTTH